LNLTDPEIDQETTVSKNKDRKNAKNAPTVETDAATMAILNDPTLTTEYNEGPAVNEAGDRASDIEALAAQDAMRDIAVDAANSTLPEIGEFDSEFPETVLETASEPAADASDIDDENVSEPTTETPKVGRAKAPIDPTIFALVGEFKPIKGLATEMYNELHASPANAEQLTARLLESGAYVKVAPQAAKLRALKPVVYQLKVWNRKGLLVAVTPTTDAPTTDEPAADAATV
jgi:hypothetical protein